MSKLDTGGPSETHFYLSKFSNFFRYIFLPPNSTHMTQPLDVAVFAPMKKVWRRVLDEYKAECASKSLRNTSIPKDKFGYLLSRVLEKGAINNAKNIKAGFAACGIYPLDANRVLSRLPPENNVGEVQAHFSHQLSEELKRTRYGEQKKTTRAKKANRLPPGMAYTVSAVPVPEEASSAGKFSYT